MMRVVDVRPADIIFTLEIGLQDLQKLELALNKANIDFDGNNSEEKEAVDFLTQVFCPTISEMIKRGRG